MQADHRIAPCESRSLRLVKRAAHETPDVPLRMPHQLTRIALKSVLVVRVDQPSSAIMLCTRIAMVHRTLARAARKGHVVIPGLCTWIENGILGMQLRAAAFSLIQAISIELMGAGHLAGRILRGDGQRVVDTPWRVSCCYVRTGGGAACRSHGR